MSLSGTPLEDDHCATPIDKGKETRPADRN